MSCPYAHDDAAYVLGALDATERADYERHLSGCADCSRSVRELAGLPGLLARVPLEVLEPPAEQAPLPATPPATLLPAVVAEVRRRRRQRVARTVAVAAAAAVLLVGGTVAVLTVADDDDPPAAAPAEVTTAPARQMDSRAEGVTGWVSLTAVPWGTRIDLTCTYGTAGGHGGADPYGGDDHGEYDDAGRTSYVLFVRTTDDRVEQVGTWRVEAGAEAHVTMATAATPGEIAEVEVRTAAGESVLRLTL